MISALCAWAAGSWHVVQARAVQAGLVPHCAPTVGQLDPGVFLAFLEGEVCKVDEAAKQINELYAESTPTPHRAKGAARREQIARFMEAGR